MGRPDLTETRTTEILDAFERCVGRYGLEGSSLERIAEEAGMKRSILRHYVGNRDDLIHALAERVATTYRDQLQSFMDTLTDDSRIQQMIEFFLPKKPRESTESVLVIESLIAASDVYPHVCERMSAYVDDVVTMTAVQLQKACPRAKKQTCWNVAYGIVSIWFNQESLTSLNLPGRYQRGAVTCMAALISSLED